jgi:hypothetical protein
MVHEFERPKYGEGSSLQQRLELLDRFKLDWKDGGASRPGVPPVGLAAGRCRDEAFYAAKG